MAVSPGMPTHLCPTCSALRADGRLGRARPELAAVAFGVNVLGIKGPRKMMALLPRLPEGSTAVTGFRPSPYGKTALLDRCKCLDHGRRAGMPSTFAAGCRALAELINMSACRRCRTRSAPCSSPVLLCVWMQRSACNNCRLLTR